MSSDTWEYWISHVDGIDYLKSDEKEKAKDALKYIEDLFGEELTKLIAKKHPITDYISVNSAPWTRRWLISLKEAIEAMLNQINGSKVLNKIRNKDEFKEALLQLSIGKCLSDSGFKIEFLKENNLTKTIDWKITDLVTGEQILVEITETSKPTSWQKHTKWISEQLSERIHKNSLPTNNRPYLVSRGRLFREYISKPVLNELLRKIDSKAENARINGFTELVEKNIISLMFTTEDNKHLLKPWSIEQKVINSEEEFEDFADSTFRAPRFQINEVDRILTRKEDKKKQLNRRDLNILIIWDDRVFFSRKFIPTYIHYLEQFIYERDYLALLIIVGGNMRQKMGDDLVIEDAIERDNHLYLKTAISQMVKQVVIIANNYSRDNTKTLAFSSKIKKSFKACKTLLI